MGRKIHVVMALVAVLAWSKTSPILCNAWVTTASSSSSGSGGSGSTSTFSSLKNTATTQSSNSMKRSKFDKRYWMILNAVVDDGRSFGGRNSTMTYAMTSTTTTTTTTTSRKANPKIKKTNKIFVDRWNTMFERLKEYKKIHGNTKVQKKYNDGRTPSLGNWVCKQRFEALVYHNTNGEEGQITPQRIAKLETIGFVWELARQDEWEEKWLTMFSELEAFQKKYLSTKVPILDNKDGTSSQESMSSLGRWVKTQRKQRNRLLRKQPAPAMTKERLEMLESIDFAWKGRRVTDYDKWLNMYFKLLFYHQQHNTTIVSDSDGQGSSRLVEWTEEQRSLYRELTRDDDGIIQSLEEGNEDETKVNTLTQHRIDLLNEICFDWSYCHKDKSWEDMYNELVEYKENFNSTLISTSINQRLGQWTMKQREKYNSGSKELNEEQIVKLNAIHFDWNATDDVNWNAMLDRLDAYKRKHDTTIVPNHDGGDRPLANWVGNQRFKLGKYVLNEEGEYYDDDDLVERIAFDLGWSPGCEDKSRGFIRKLPPSTKATRIRRLNEIGFVWDAQEASWQDMYQRLLVFKKENNGSTSVPFSPEGGSSSSNNNNSNELGVWVRAQRHIMQRGELSEKRLLMLNEIDFEWDPLEAQWKEMFDRLCVYQQDNAGSTSVPGSYPPDPELGFWVNTQRRSYKRKTLPFPRIERLDEIGFVWEIQ